MTVKEMIYICPPPLALKGRTQIKFEVSMIKTESVKKEEMEKIKYFLFGLFIHSVYDHFLE